MIPSTKNQGIAFLCTSEGKIVRIIRDELGLPALGSSGGTLADLLDHAVPSPAADFLAALNERRAVFDWELDVLIDGTAMPMHFAAVADADLFFIIAAQSCPGLARFNQEMMLINNEQTNALRHALKELSLLSRLPQKGENHLLNDLSRANNELINLQRELARKNHELETALKEIKTLQGLIPICCQCKKIRDEHQVWWQLEAYLQDHTDARFSHSLCPDCAKVYRDDLAKMRSRTGAPNT